MLHRGRWFVLGAVALVLLIGVLWAGTVRFGGDARAEGTWRTELFDSSSYNNGAVAADPDRFVDDWLQTLPTSCDIVPIQESPIIIAYRCP